MVSFQNTKIFLKVKNIDHYFSNWNDIHKFICAIIYISSNTSNKSNTSNTASYLSSNISAFFKFHQILLDISLNISSNTWNTPNTSDTSAYVSPNAFHLILFDKTI